MKLDESYRTLVIDDDPAIHEAFRMMLASDLSTAALAGAEDGGHEAGAADASRRHFPRFEIDSAYDGEEGLKCVQQALQAGRPYAMAFVDLRMKGWDGIETISHIWKQCFDIQIVICTGYPNFTWDDITNRFGHSDRLLILKKPFALTELRQVAYSLAEKWDLSHQAQSHLERLQRLVGERTQKLQAANLSLQRKIHENQHAERRLVAQYAAARALVEISTVPEAMRRVMQIVGENLDWDWGAFWEVDGDRKSLQLKDCWQKPGCDLKAFEAASRALTLANGQGLPGSAWQRGQPSWISDVPRDRNSPRALIASQDGLHGAVAFPIWTGTQLHGVMEFASRQIVEQDRDQLQTFLVIGSFIGQFIERKLAEQDRSLMEVQLRHAQKLESIGQLAAGIAHEINTPTQYIGDNIRFLESSFADVRVLHAQLGSVLTAAREQRLTPQVLAEAESALRSADMEYYIAEIPKAVEQALEGVGRVSKIVRAMKEFSHPGSAEKTAVNLNQAIDTTITVARNEWKYVATIDFDFDPNLPLVPCLPGGINQVILNLVVNAAHAIGDVIGQGGERKGRITISTKLCEPWAEIRIRDTGSGIPELIRHKIFDPFFTTKPVGKGTGQGLAIAHNVIVDQHGGSLTFETEMGVGTVFIIRLPLVPAVGARRQTPAKENSHETCSIRG